MNRNEYVWDGWILKKVVDFSIFEGFDCGDDDLTDFIQNDAAWHASELLAQTYSLHDVEDTTTSPPVAFASLLNDSLSLTSNRQKRQLPNKARRYGFYPAVKIGRLGVECEFARQGLGSQVLDMVKRLFLTDNRTGCRFITVDAYRHDAVLRFYQKNDFQFLTEVDASNHTRCMYFDLARFQLGSTTDS